FVVSFVLMLFSAFFSVFNQVEKITITVLILITLVNIGALLEQRKWIYYLEYSRAILLIAFVFFEFGYTDLIFIPIIALVLIEQKLNLKDWYLYSFLHYQNNNEDATESN